MSGMRAHLANRLRSTSLSAVPPPRQSSDYSHTLAKMAASVLYRSPLPSGDGRPVFVLNAAALPDSHEADFDKLLPYVLARLPEEDDLLKGFEYEVVFFAGDGDGSVTTKKHRPSWGWFLQAYHVLSRAMRKRLQKLYIVHEKAWVRILTEIFSTIVSPKFRRKTFHVSTLTQLAREIPLTDLLIPPSTYLTDRRISGDIFVANASGKRAFAARDPFPTGSNGSKRFPRVLRETTGFILMENNVVTEGLFRVPPHSKLRDCLKEAYDRGQKYIVWKDNDCLLPLPPYPQAEHQDEILAEVVSTDAYSVFMACAMIKAWYASLRQPLFPTDAYRDLKRLYGNPLDLLDLNRLKDIFSPTSEWSLLTGASREIAVRHLLPLLSAIAARQEQNKMTAENLAVCFAPALLCGPDQLEDAKMSSIIRRIFTQAIDMWTEGLREACGQTEDAFYAELRLPLDESDWEDPLPGKQSFVGSWADPLEEQMTIITLEDNEKQSAYVEPPQLENQAPPPLPPRTQTSKASAESLKRKPAPAIHTPPRYSSVIFDAPEDLAESPLAYATTTNDFTPLQPNNSIASPTAPQWSTDEKKSGTNNSVSVSAPIPDHLQGSDASGAVNPFAPMLIIPKRKSLTATQIESVEKSAVAQNEVHHMSPSKIQAPHGGFALPGMMNKPSTSVSTKRASPSTYAHSEASTSPTSVASSPAYDTRFRRPSIPSSLNTNRSPSFTSLARPVYPAPPPIPKIHQPPSQSPSDPSSSPKSTGPRLRAPSAALLRRMPSFEKAAGKEDEGGRAAGHSLAPKKLNLKKQSVEDLRRLYEERAGTASAIVEAGRQR